MQVTLDVDMTSLSTRLMVTFLAADYYCMLASTKFYCMLDDMPRS